MTSDAGDTLTGSTEKVERRSLLADFFIRLVKEKPLGTVGAIIILMLLIAGIFANFLAPYPMAETHFDDILSPPSTTYILGTDDLGRDMLSRIIFGARVSMIVGLVGSIFAILISATIGLISGFLGGIVDMVVQRFVDAFMSIPAIFLILCVMSVTGPGLWQVVLVTGVIFGIGGSRVVRSAVIGIKKNVYVESSVAIGSTTGELLIKHILPNIMAPIIILFTTRMGNMILIEATVSFLGYGIQPPTPSWGGMLSGSARRYMLQAYWMALYPGIALAAVIYGINMLGDAMRDILDPRLRGGLGSYRRVKIKKLLHGR